MARKAVIYARVSTGKQDTGNQVVELQEWAVRAGVDVVKHYIDNGISGAKGRDKRPELDAMLKAVTRREFDMILVWSLDRLGRSTRDLANISEELRQVGVDLYLHKQALDTSTPHGRMFFTILGALAEYERELIRERIYAGLATARRKGKRLGRRPIDIGTARKVVRLHKKGVSGRQIAQKLGIGRATVQRAIKQHET